MSETEIPIPTNDQLPLVTINKPNQLVRVRYRGVDRLVDIVDTLSDIEMEELCNDYNLKGCEDVNNALKTRIRCLPYKKHTTRCLPSLVYIICLIILLTIIGFLLFKFII